MKEESIETWARRTGAAVRIRDLYQPTQPQGQAPAGSPPDINYKLFYVWPGASRHLGLTPPQERQLPPAPDKDGTEYDPSDRPWRKQVQIEAFPDFLSDSRDPWDPGYNPDAEMER